MTRLLEGIRVLDIGRYVAGPYCATLLGYFGAEVIRVERPRGGEDRYIAPLFTRDDGAPGEGGLFMQTACGKKSLTLNLSHPDGLEALKKLASQCDVICANLPPKALEKLGLDWRMLSKINPKAILVTQTGFGARGPDKDKGGFDGVAQAMSGAMYLSGAPDAPVKAGAPYADFTTAVFSALGVMAALMAREKTGEGQHVETTLLGTALAAMNSHLAEQAVTQINRAGTGNRVQTSGPSDVFATKDGHILVHTVGDGLFKRWTAMVERPELVDDPRLQGDQARGDARDELCAIMADWCKTRTTEDALAALAAAGVPSGPVLTMQEALDNPQAQAMAFFKPTHFPGLPREAPVADLPIDFSALDAGVSGRPPQLGEHTEEILKSIGYDDKTLAAMRKDSVI
ncbi:CaiB/BaiF CoA transferase family protein [Hyphococcus sp.]|uniref:CaiB/BaiF CoA transferase family protein n=1 Tax=Hyphococcus sp. TaxID=2038636 RepID=UPI003CCC2A88